jgi:hypothetical protein
VYFSPERLVVKLMPSLMCYNVLTEASKNVKAEKGIE